MPGDGVTSVTAPTFRVELNGNVAAGLVVELYEKDQAEPFATHTLTEDDICQGWVDLAVPGEVDDGWYGVVARLASADGERGTAFSAPYYVELDSSIAPPELDVTSIELGADQADGFVVSGTAEAFSQVTLTLTAGEDNEATYTATADSDGRFRVQVAAASLGAGAVTVLASATDRAGNTAFAIQPSTIEVVGDPSAPVEVHGTGDDDVIVQASAATVFIPGNAWAQDYYIGSAEGFHTIRIDGNSSSYTITLVSEEVRAYHGNLLQLGYDITLGDVPLYRIENWQSPGEVLWVQADRIVFNDGEGTVVTLADDGAVLASGAETTIHGGAGDDYIVGGSGDDTLFGHDGNDTLVGGSGNDILVSNSGNDTLIGGAGNDVLVALGDPASGDGTRVDMHGGAGEDVFVIAAGHPMGGTEVTIHKDVTIHDFVIGEDRIDLSRMFVNDDGCIRAATIGDLDLGTLSSQLHDAGVMEIDLSGFVREDGAALEGALEVRLAGGVSTIDAGSFIFQADECLHYDIDDLMFQASLLSPV